MTVKITGADHNFYICEEHAEECSLKNLKEIINGKIDKFKELRRQMVDLGIDLSPRKPVAKPATTPATAPTQQATKTVQMSQKAQLLQKKPPVVQRQIRTIGSSDASSYQSHDIDGAVDKEAQIMSEQTGREVKVAKTVEREEQEVSGVCGTKMVVPKKLRSNDGSVTTISIVKTSHNDIMKRIDPEHGIAPPKDCSLCRGSGYVNKGNQQCPKCNGTGIL